MAGQEVRLINQKQQWFNYQSTRDKSLSLLEISRHLCTLAKQYTAGAPVVYNEHDCILLTEKSRNIQFTMSGE